MRRWRNRDAVLLRLFESERYVIDHACVGIEKQRGLDLFRQTIEKLCLSCLAGKLTIPPDDNNLRWQPVDLCGRIGDQKEWIFGKLAFANTTRDPHHPLRAPGGKDNRAVDFGRH